MKFSFFFIFLFFICFLASNIFAADKVEINTASLQQLDTITGIGQVIAQRIIDARPFSSLNDLLRVKGIGEKTLQKIKDQGLAYVGSGPLHPEPQTKEYPPIADAKVTDASVVQTYPSGVVINEILPSPQGADEQSEWIELYNFNDYEINLSGWKIEDTEGAKTTYVLPENTKIAGLGYLLFKRPETKITLNNSTDGLNLIWPNDKIADSLTYNSAPTNQSYNKTKANWQWSASLTPGSKNIITATSAKNAKQSLPNLQKSGNNNGIEAGLAAVNEINPVRNGVSNGASPWFLFLTALTTTIILSSVVLFIKLKVFKKNSSG